MRSRSFKVKNRPLANIAFVSLIALVAAGCSENTSRFADPLFTASVPGAPVPVDKFGTPLSPASRDGLGPTTPLTTSAPRPDRAYPQRVDVAGEQPRVADTFNARNITRLAKDQNFKPGEFRRTPTDHQQFANLPQGNAVTRPTTQHSSAISSQSLPPVQSLPAGAALTEPSANEVNETSAPLLARRHTPTPVAAPVTRYQAPVTATNEGSSESGTEWTRKYSPVPTQSPRPRVASRANGPRAYTPPSGGTTNKIDSFQTSALKKGNSGPKLVRASSKYSTTSVTQTASASSNAKDGVIVVASGDTLSRISARHNVRLSALKQANNIGDNNLIRVGQKLVLPGGSSTIVAKTSKSEIDTTQTASIQPKKVTKPEVLASAKVPEARPGPKVSDVPPVSTSIVQAKQNLPAVETARVSVNALPRLDGDEKLKPYTKPKVDERKVASLDGGTPVEPAGSPRFKWPVRGNIIGGFGQNTDGTKNDGINISVERGTPIRATAGGEVIYASDGLKRYGKLVVIRHTSNYVSTYAYNSELNVRRGDRVRQGQVIAKSGNSGPVTQPQLLFEIREGTVPVDPLAYLAR